MSARPPTGVFRSAPAVPGHRIMYAGCPGNIWNIKESVVARRPPVSEGPTADTRRDSRVHYREDTLLKRGLSLRRYLPCHATALNSADEAWLRCHGERYGQAPKSARECRRARSRIGCDGICARAVRHLVSRMVPSFYSRISLVLSDKAWKLFFSSTNHGVVRHGYSI